MRGMGSNMGGCRRVTSGTRRCDGSFAQWLPRCRMGRKRHLPRHHHRQITALPEPGCMDRLPRSNVIGALGLEDGQNALGTIRRP